MSTKSSLKKKECKPETGLMVKIKELTINPVDGSVTIASATTARFIKFKLSLIHWFRGEKALRKVKTKLPIKIFDDVSSYFKEHAKATSHATHVTPVTIHELTGKDNNLIAGDMFKSIADDLDTIIMTQHQMVEFCKQYPNELKHDNVHFLGKNIYDRYYITKVRSHSGGSLDARVFFVDEGPVIKAAPSHQARKIIQHGKQRYVRTESKLFSPRIVVPIFT